MEINEHGDFFLVDSEASEVRIFDNKGTAKGFFRVKDSNGNTTTPRGIALDENGYLYISIEHEIKMYTPSGIELFSWGSLGSGEENFDTPTGITIDSEYYIYICDAGNFRIKKYPNLGEIKMIAGIFLIIAGILIAMYPPLLSIIFAGLLIFGGLMLILLHYHYRRVSRSFDNPFMDFFIRF